MKKPIYHLFLLIILFSVSCKVQKNHETAELKLETFQDTISYIIGADVATNLKNNSIEVVPEIFTQVFTNITNGKESIFNPEESQNIIMEFQKQIQTKQEEKMNQDALESKLEGKKFLVENKLKEGVIETSTGLQYKAIKKGEGEKPKDTSKVTVHYEGKLTNGSIFDSSYERGETISFGLNQVIPGWTEGLQLMTTGSTYEFYIPSELGYGDRSIPGIPANSTLIFKVELFSFE